MEERCRNLLKELYTDFSVFIIYNLLHKKKGSQELHPSQTIRVSLSLCFAHYCIS